MITRIDLNRFKTWESLSITLGKITVLFGTNSAGKTSVLQSLLMLKQTASSFDRNQAIHFGDPERDYVDLGSYRDLVFQHDESHNMGLRLQWETATLDFTEGYKYADVSLSYEVSWGKPKDKDTVVVDTLNYEVKQNHADSMFLKMVREDDVYRVTTPPRAKSTRGQPRQLRAPENSFAIPSEIKDDYKPDFTEFNRQFRALMDRIYYLGPLRNHPRRTYTWTGSMPTDIGAQGENTIPVLIGSARQTTVKKRKGSKPTLIDDVSRSLSELGLLEQFTVEAVDKDKRFYTANVRASGQATNASLIDIGFGVSQVMPIITALFFVPEGSILLIEQPELHLHPLAQAKLADLMLNVAHTRRLQLIVESHSEHILRRFQRRVAETYNSVATPDNLRLYFATRIEGASKMETVEMTPYGQIKNWPDDFFGDVSGDLEKMMDAGRKKRRQELQARG